MTNQEVALGALLLALLIMSSIDATAKFALYLGIFLLAMAWLTAFENGTLQKTVQAFTKPGG